jgi:4-diphosphocytidyl-2-C-methyl-D-erythritol kinase
MVVFPKAKINLGLRITGKLPDGYHEIETVFYPVNLSDALELVTDSGKSGKDVFVQTGNKLPGLKEDNIVLKAVARLRKSFTIPSLRLHLHKKIPAGSGLGGGSSDAASTIRTLNRMFDLSLSTDDMRTISAGIGSDCPFFIECQPAFASGKGDILTPLGNILHGHYIVLVNPGILISTKEAYDRCIPVKPERSLFNLIKNPVSEWKEVIINDFEKTIFSSHPEIKEIKNELYGSGAFYSSMSGSGSTVYGIFPGKPVIPYNLTKYIIYEGNL